MSISSAARQVARRLQASNLKAVFAESCTGGLVSGALTKIAGISSYHCGGVVVYRNETKMAYLKIPPKLLKQPGPVSAEVASLMAQRVLEITPEANIAAAVTGHLGPAAPPELDGHVYVAIAWRANLRSRPKQPVVRFVCCRAGQSRAVRQRWVVEQVLDLLSEQIAAARKP